MPTELQASLYQGHASLRGHLSDGWYYTDTFHYKPTCNTPSTNYLQYNYTNALTSKPTYMYNTPCYNATNYPNRLQYNHYSDIHSEVYLQLTLLYYMYHKSPILGCNVIRCDILHCTLQKPTCNTACHKLLGCTLLHNQVISNVLHVHCILYVVSVAHMLYVLYIIDIICKYVIASGRLAHPRQEDHLTSRSSVGRKGKQK